MIIGDNYGHGGDIYKNSVKMDFSANVNPLGTPPEVTEAVRRAALTLSAYPDPYCTALREKLALRHGVSPDDIICGNGAAELIFQLTAALRVKKALLPVPSFSEYEAALRASGCESEFYSLTRESGFAVTEDILRHIDEDTDIVMLCSPNNPTGRAVERELLIKLLGRCRETGTWLFLDECFTELCTGESALSMIPELREGDRVFILRAFTKLYGMAGARLGYAVCRNSDMLRRMSEISQPWNISSLAQAAGEAALGCTEFAERTIALITEEKKYLLSQLEALGIKALPGEANFLMLSGEPGLALALLERGILIRRCGNYRGLDEGDCRIAVKTHGENERLIAALREIKNA